MGPLSVTRRSYGGTPGGVGRVIYPGSGAALSLPTTRVIPLGFCGSVTAHHLYVIPQAPEARCLRGMWVERLRQVSELWRHAR